jgi:hypothetical protein
MNSDSGIQLCEEGESFIAIDIEHPIPLNKKKEGSNNFEWKFEKEAEARTLKSCFDSKKFWKPQESRE